jgi:hypothetical protein
MAPCHVRLSRCEIKTAVIVVAVRLPLAGLLFLLTKLMLWCDLVGVVRLDYPDTVTSGGVDVDILAAFDGTSCLHTLFRCAALPGRSFRLFGDPVTGNALRLKLRPFIERERINV